MIELVIKIEDKLYYSEEYLRRQIETAYFAGVTNNSSIEFHAVTPVDEEHSACVANSFFEIVNKRYKDAMDSGNVIRKHSDKIPDKFTPRKYVSPLENLCDAIKKYENQ